MILSSDPTLATVAARRNVRGVFARWLSEVAHSRTKWVAIHFVCIFVLGGVTGLTGPALAHAIDSPGWADVLSGTLGAIGAVGFQTVLQWAVRAQPA